MASSGEQIEVNSSSVKTTELSDKAEDCTSATTEELKVKQVANVSKLSENLETVNIHHGDCVPATLEKIQEVKKEIKSTDEVEMNTVLIDSDSDLLKDKSGKMSNIYKIIKWDPWQRNAHKNIPKNKSKTKDIHPKPVENEDHIEAQCSQTTKQPAVLKSVIKSPRLYDKYDDDSFTLDSNVSETTPQPAPVRKGVKFLPNVLVLHFVHDKIVEQTTEPLKKELEQQERNKRMRNAFNPEIFPGLSLRTNDYISGWFRK